MTKQIPNAISRILDAFGFFNRELESVITLDLGSGEISRTSWQITNDNGMLFFLMYYSDGYWWCNGCGVGNKYKIGSRLKSIIRNKLRETTSPFYKRGEK